MQKAKSKAKNKEKFQEQPKITPEKKMLIEYRNNITKEIQKVRIYLNNLISNEIKFKKLIETIE